MMIEGGLCSKYEYIIAVN